MNQQQNDANRTSPDAHRNNHRATAAQQPPVVVRSRLPQRQPARSLLTGNPPAMSGALRSGAPDDGSIQAAIDKKLNTDRPFRRWANCHGFLNGKVTLMGQ